MPHRFTIYTVKDLGKKLKCSYGTALRRTKTRVTKTGSRWLLAGWDMKILAKQKVRRYGKLRRTHR